MKIHLHTVVLALALIAPAAAAHRAEASGARTAVSSAESADLRARFVQDLAALRAGRVESPRVFRTDERAELTTATARSADLVNLRAGELTDHEWTLIAIGALVVLILVLI
jgi:uncharacterized membrane protein